MARMLEVRAEWEQEHRDSEAVTEWPDRSATPPLHWCGTRVPTPPARHSVTAHSFVLVLWRWVTRIFLARGGSCLFGAFQAES